MRKLTATLSLLLAFAITHAQSNRQYTRAYRDSVLNTFIGKDYPAFTLTLSNGKTIDSKKLKGKVIFMNVWFGGCVGCLEEFSTLNRLADSVKADSNIIFLSAAMEPKERLTALINKYQITHPVAYVTPDVAAKLNYSQGYPANIIIDPTGKITLFKVEGFSEKRAQEVMLGQWLPMMRKMEAVTN
jgi:peroxiredoxin